MQKRLPAILVDNIFKHFIPKTFPWDNVGVKVYESFHMLITSDAIRFIFYVCKDVDSATSSNIEEFFDFSLVLSHVPHLKINQRVSNNIGHAQRMGTQIISIFNSFQNLQYIETDTVNPITYHISAKQRFKPVCAVDRRKKCMPSRDDILQRIHHEYTDIITGSDGSLSDGQKVRIEDLFNIVKGPDDTEFQGVKMRLYKHDNYEKRSGVYKRRSSIYLENTPDVLYGGAQSRSSPSPGSAMVFITGCAWLLFASLLGSGPHRYFLP
jgi:hypothetical protein